MELTEIPRIYTAIAEFIACYLYIAFARKRFNGLSHYIVVLTTFSVIIGFQIIAGILPIEFWVPGMIVAFLLMFYTIYIVANLNIITSLYFSIQAFVLAEFVAAFEWQIYYFYANTTQNESNFMSVLFMIIIYGLIFMIVFFLEKRYRKTRNHIEIQRTDVLSFLGIAIAVFSISNFSFLNLNSPFSSESTAEIFYIRTLVDFVGVIFLYSQREHKMSVQLKVETSVMEQLLRKQYEHFQLTHDTIDMVNHKYHDLKHQLALIQLEDNKEIRDKYLKDLQEGMDLYETNFQTGNEVLDILLSVKSLKCINNDITLTVVADGKILSFMNPMDLSSIIGNALDNAIENVINIEQSDKRLIKLAIFKEKNM